MYMYYRNATFPLVETVSKMAVSQLFIDFLKGHCYFGK